MYRLYENLKDRESPATKEEKLIASGKKVLNQTEESAYLAKLEKTLANIAHMFQAMEASFNLSIIF